MTDFALVCHLNALKTYQSRTNFAVADLNKRFKDYEVILKRGMYKGHHAIIRGVSLWSRAGGYKVSFALDIYYKDKSAFISKDYHSKADARRYYSVEEFDFVEAAS